MFRKQKSFVCLGEASRALGENPPDPIGETYGDRYRIRVRGSLVVADEDSKRVKDGYETHVLCGNNCGVGAVVTCVEKLKKGQSYVIKNGIPVLKDSKGVMEINFPKIDSTAS